MQREARVGTAVLSDVWIAGRAHNCRGEGVRGSGAVDAKSIISARDRDESEEGRGSSIAHSLTAKGSPDQTVGLESGVSPALPLASPSDLSEPNFPPDGKSCSRSDGARRSARVECSPSLICTCGERAKIPTTHSHSPLPVSVVLVSVVLCSRRRHVHVQSHSRSGCQSEGILSFLNRCSTTS